MYGWDLTLVRWLHIVAIAAANMEVGNFQIVSHTLRVEYLRVILSPFKMVMMSLK
jgi:hypothetical protein